MSTGPSRYADIFVRLLPSRSNRDETWSKRGSTRSYDAFVYTDLPLDNLSPVERAPESSVYSRTSAPRNPSVFASQPLVAQERLIVRKSRYQEYLAAFLEGEKTPYSMRDRLIETMSPGLEMLFSGAHLADEGVRVWWGDAETPEIRDLPWELLAYSSRSQEGGRFSFVRGLPPPPSPLVSVEQLRLALIHDPACTPAPLLQAIDDLPPGIEVIRMPKHPRASLLEAVKNGYELLHIVADGLLSLAYEGILSLPGTTSPEVLPGELAGMLRGSRVTCLGLTPLEGSSPDVVDIRGRKVPSVYRAFAYLGGTRHPLPTTVAPLGPVSDEQVYQFWRGFYSSLAETPQVDVAMAHGQTGGAPVPMALFLRHLYGRLFRRRQGEQPRGVDPIQLNVDLQVSRDLVDQLKVLGMQHDLPDSVRDYLNSENARQERVAEELDGWLESEQDDA